MLERGRAKKLIIYISALEEYEGESAYQKIVSFLHNHGCAGATVTRGVSGFGASGEVHKARLLSLTDDVPMRIEVIDTGRKLSALLPFIYDYGRERINRDAGYGGHQARATSAGGGRRTRFEARKT
jgi:PII-like signaling protein